MCVSKDEYDYARYLLPDDIRLVEMSRNSQKYKRMSGPSYTYQPFFSIERANARSFSFL